VIVVVELVGSAVALACLLFVLSLPLSATGFGKTLRMWAGFLFVLVLGPSLFFGALKQTVGGGGRNASNVGLGDVLAAIGVLAILSVAAYVALQVRSRKGGTKRDAMADFFSRKSSGKEPVARRDDDDGVF
jgi:hypothetical protein